jgi:uncharacterized protein (DUF1499 family)
MTPTSHAQPQRPPALVNWLGYLAITLLLALPAAVLTVRAGAWQQGLLLYAISCLGAAILLAAGVLLMLLPRFAAWRRAIAWRALVTLPGTVLLLSILGAGSVPRIHDITTDVNDPPIFTAAQQQRPAGSNSLDIDPATLAQQVSGYPDIKTLVMALDYEQVYERAVQVATAMGWEIYFQDRDAGLIEAVDTTAIMHFRDDIVVRLRTNAAGTLVDVRSVSRVGVSDMGANARRIAEFLERMQAP